MSDDQPVSDVSPGVTDSDEGPGWLPAIMAGTVLFGIIGFVMCGFTTWLLFQKRTEFAVRTLNAAYLPEIEQSLLSPEEKADVLDQVSKLAKGMERGKFENWQSAGILQRLQRTPVIAWGELQAIESFAQKNADPDHAAEISKQLSRLRKSVADGNGTSFDFEDVLKPVYVADSSSPSGHRLKQPLDMASIGEVVTLAKLVADREKVPDQTFPDVRIGAIVRDQIQSGTIDGGF
ncbi:hypothetical protein K227x_47570 [Rubripirellula lacrimiformis]|uniref:Uncharacterized protein n=1 Tax=Rubripirellula lacrimiformis TaxID=1930273 RepID=A0A517NGY9_9BACT|nr:hypothetical protein [Rubripirellula lacrimiformis]QDT06348.1 hypothetical protein K227x_47570 [Rubripirellula lacrimiformis]